MNEYRDSGRPDNTNYGASDYDPTDYPTVHYCAECEHPCSSDYSGPDEGFECAADCGNWLCAAHKGFCEQCRIDREEAVAAEAARLESEIEKNKEALLRTMNI